VVHYGTLSTKWYIKFKHNSTTRAEVHRLFLKQKMNLRLPDIFSKSVYLEMIERNYGDFFAGMIFKFLLSAILLFQIAPNWSREILGRFPGDLSAD